MTGLPPLRRTLARLAGALACLMMLGACTSEPSQDPPSIAPAPTHAASTTPSPTPTPAPSPKPSGAPTFGRDQDVTRPPTPPAALDGPATEDNTVLVAKYFMAQIPYAASTGDLKTWDRMSGESCKYCANIRRTIEEIHDAGQRSVGGALDLGYAIAGRHGDRWLVAIDYVEHPSKTLNSDGSVAEEFLNTGIYRAHLEVTQRSGRWIVVGVRVEDQA